MPIAATAAVDPIGFATPVAAGANAAGDVADEPGATGITSEAAAPPVDAAWLAAFGSPPDAIAAPVGFAAAGFAAAVAAGVAETGGGVFAMPLPGIARPAVFGMPLADGVGSTVIGALSAGMAMPAVFAGSVPAAFANAAVDVPAPAVFATPAVTVPAAAVDAAPRDGAPGLSQPAGAAGSTAARAAAPAGALRRSPRCASFGFQSVGRA
ncbi:hypothetical protein I6G56_06675 [Burkholderia humptydooensis]|uniref:Uncharacterized protein n=1 Tax=Burkholderia humptydooensis TaxID=430531 RepID=A0A7T2WZ76_9BURK|nr:hypothetical protein I6G56_06675 [Burkholderia humptydooensis]